MNTEKWQAWWSYRQGLDGSLAGKTASEVLERAGWARSVGGVGPYLTLFSRAGIGRETADGAVAALDISELPAARGCTYVLPACDFTLGLAAGRSFADEDMKVARKLGVTDSEVDKLCAAITRALRGGPLEPEGIRSVVGGAARSLGEEGKKKGVGTTLPLALGRLQAQGEIRRLPVNGRLDQQRYAYTLWEVHSHVSEGEAFTELARRYFRWVGPAALVEFQWFSGLSLKAAKAAVAPLGLVPFDEEPGRLMFADDHEAYRAFRVPKEAQYVLVSSLDSISALRRDVKTLLGPKDADRVVFAERGGPKPLGGITDLPNHAILDRGRVVGLWEYDIVCEQIAWRSFVPKNRALEAAVKETETFVREQLGDARSFSLDSPKSREPKIAALRSLGSC